MVNTKLTKHTNIFFNTYLILNHNYVNSEKKKKHSEAEKIIIYVRIECSC